MDNCHIADIQSKLVYFRIKLNISHEELNMQKLSIKIISIKYLIKSTSATLKT